MLSHIVDLSISTSFYPSRVTTIIIKLLLKSHIIIHVYSNVVLIFMCGKVDFLEILINIFIYVYKYINIYIILILRENWLFLSFFRVASDKPILNSCSSCLSATTAAKPDTNRDRFFTFSPKHREAQMKYHNTVTHI